MNVYEDRVTTKQEYYKYLKGERGNNGISKILEKIVMTLSPAVRKEAKSKGFILREINKQELDLINLLIEVPDASLELQLELSNNHPFIICE